MFSTDLGTCECGGRAVVMLHGELDVMDAASAAVAISAIAQLINVLSVHACVEDMASTARQFLAADAWAARGRPL